MSLGRSTWKMFRAFPSVTGLCAGGISLIIMTFIIVAEVLYRELFRKTTLLSDELSGYLVVVITFLGAAHTLRKNSHISFDSLLLVLTPAQGRILGVISKVLSLAIVSMLTYGAYVMWEMTYMQGARSTTLLAVPLVLPQGAMCLGLALLALEVCYQLVSKK